MKLDGTYFPISLSLVGVKELVLIDSLECPNGARKYLEMSTP